MQGETARVTFATRLHSGPPIFADRNTIGNHMNKGQKNTVVRIAASALLLGTAWLPLLSPALHIALCAAAYLVIGADILFRAVRNILHGKIFDENFLMSVATVGAFAIGEYPEAVAVMLFYQTGEAVSGYGRSPEPQIHRSADGYPSRLRQSGRCPWRTAPGSTG